MSNQKIENGNDAGKPLFPLHGAMSSLFLDPVTDTDNAIHQLQRFYTLDLLATELKEIDHLMRSSPAWKNMDDVQRGNLKHVLTSMRDFIAAVYYYNPSQFKNPK